LVARGQLGVQLVIPRHHEGLKNAIAKVLGAPWQRCTCSAWVMQMVAFRAAGQ
jgi:transposase-like protein